MNSFKIDINRNHSLFLFITIIFLGGVELFIDLNLILEQYPVTVSVICFFLISTIGVSHGSLDNLKGAKLLKKLNIKNIAVFYLAYVLIAIFIILLWIFIPVFTLIVFLIVASYHFGKEDNVRFFSFEKRPNTKFKFIYFFLKGSIVVSAPLLFNQTETLQIFKALNIDLENINYSLILIFMLLSIASNIFLNEYWAHPFLDSFTIIFLNAFFSPLIAFTIYFCFLHSLRHSLSLIEDLNKKKFKKGLNIFLKKSLPLTVLTMLIFILGLFFLNKYYMLDSAILKVIFIGLASLTFPHILLEYLLEKNEKRT